MNREEVMNSIQLKKRFCKDANVPMGVFDNPYFMQRLKVWNYALPGILEKFDVFVGSMEGFKTEQDYFEYYNSVKEAVITDIKSQAGYQKLQAAVFQWADGLCHVGDISFPSEPWNASVRQNLYSENNCGKAFLSIDMKKANFTALRTFDPTIFGDAGTWEEYLSKFTSLPSIINSKYIRQVIFGACNPKRQVMLEQWFMLNVLHFLKKEVPEVQLYSLTGDEIILEVGENSLENLYPKDKIEEALKLTAVQGSLKAEEFVLYKIPGTDGYIRKHSEGTETFKCLNSETGHQILKYYMGEAVTEDDLVFHHNGQLAKFLSPLPDPFF